MIGIAEKAILHYENLYGHYLLITGSHFKRAQKEKAIWEIKDALTDHIQASEPMASYLEGEERKTLLQLIQKLNDLYDAYAGLFKRIIDVYHCFYIMLENLEHSLFGHLLLKQRNINYKYKTLFNPTFLNHYYEKGDLEEKHAILKGQLHALNKDDSFALLTVKDEEFKCLMVIWN